MYESENKRVLRRLIEEVVNTGDVSVLPQLVSPDCVVSTGKEKISCGIEGMAAHVLAVRQTYPDLEVRIENQITEHGGAANTFEALMEIGAIRTVRE